MPRRLVDAFSRGFTEDDVDFAIPRLDADLPLWLDPFLLWSWAVPVRGAGRGEVLRRVEVPPSELE